MGICRRQTQGRLSLNSFLFQYIILVFSIGLLSSCATVSTETEGSQDEFSSDAEEFVYEGLTEEAAQILEREILSMRKEAEQEATEEDSQPTQESTEKLLTRLEEEGKEEKVLRPRVPVVINKHVRKWINYFAVKDRARFKRFLRRGEVYRDVVETVLEENDLPADLYYLAMIESGYSTHARSWASAVGVWQFIRTTGRIYGLRQDAYVDERRDPIRATEAAARHLKDLYKKYGSWYLALSAYNAGPGRVNRAIRRTHSRDYWKMVARRKLPRETRNYVPKFLAALIIGQNPEKFGFRDFGAERYPSVESVEVPSPLKLETIAQAAGVPVKEIKRVNPHIRRNVTPPGVKKYEVWIPEAQAPLVKSKHQELAKLTVKGLRHRRLASHSRRGAYYRVRRGDTLSRIARRNRVSVKYIRRLNGLKSNRIRAGQRLRVVSRGYHRKNQRGGSYYRVRRGDTLSQIARANHLSIGSLKRLNGLRSHRIRVGQRLRVVPRGGSPATLSRKGRYRVRVGDSLHRIARRFSTTVKHLKRMNRLKGTRIYVGQVLQVKPKS